MQIDSVDLFYFSMPTVLDIGDGSQDLLLVRIAAGPYVGWGECEASPLVSIASFVTPMSHSACKPVRDSVLGQRLDDVDDIRRIGNLVRANSLDLLQADHMLSGIDIALWDVLGKRCNEPVWRLLGNGPAHPKMPYASSLFGDTPATTHALAVGIARAGHGAAKFGWGPYGRFDAASDREQVAAAREGLGPDAALMIDAGTVWLDDVETAAARLAALNEFDVIWLEEPFISGALAAYRSLAGKAGSVRIAAGEGSHDVWGARHLIDHGGIGYVQIDAGRIGGITPARDVAMYARSRGVAYVNHTFTSHLALSASLQPFVDSPMDALCEYPIDPKPLAIDLTVEHLRRDDDGLIHVPDRPGLGMTIDVERVRGYLVDTEIRVAGQVLYRTPPLEA